MVELIYQRGETYVLGLEVKDDSGEYYDPDTSVTAEIIDPNGVVKSSGSMVRDSVGNYHYDYTIQVSDDIGVWYAKVICVDGTRTTIKSIGFMVEDL